MSWNNDILVAHQIHMNSLRNSAPFIEVNCAAIPSELIESELFGHVKGALEKKHLSENKVPFSSNW